MHCGSCIRRVSLALASVQGTEVKQVSLGKARLSANLVHAGTIEALAPINLAIAALAKAGYFSRLET
jgi:copper chaperone CopZ